MKLRLKKEFVVSPEDKKRIRELDEMFISGDMPYLNGKKLPAKIAEEIYSLWNKYKMGGIYYGFNHLLDLEKRDEKSSTRTIKANFAMTYMLNWLAIAEKTLTAKKLFHCLTSRESFRVLYYNIYEEVE